MAPNPGLYFMSLKGFHSYLFHIYIYYIYSEGSFFSGELKTKCGTVEDRQRGEVNI